MQPSVSNHGKTSATPTAGTAIATIGTTALATGGTQVGWEILISAHLGGTPVVGTDEDNIAVNWNGSQVLILSIPASASAGVSSAKVSTGAWDGSHTLTATVINNAGSGCIYYATLQALPLFDAGAGL